jgi:hypothetical protein
MKPLRESNPFLNPGGRRYYADALLRGSLRATASAWRDAYPDAEKRRINLPRMLPLLESSYPSFYRAGSELSEQHQWLCIFRFVMGYDDPRNSGDAQPDLIDEIMGIDRSTAMRLYFEFEEQLKFIANDTHLLKEPAQ